CWWRSCSLGLPAHIRKLGRHFLGYCGPPRRTRAQGKKLGELVRLEEGEWRGLVTVVLRPFFLGAVMQATDNKPPALVPAKGRYMGRDLNRLSRALGLRVRIPSRFPALTLLAQRVLVALDRHDRASTSGAQGQRRLRAVSKRLWQIYWEEDGDLNDVPTLTAALVASGCTEEEAALLLQNAPSAEVKDELKAATDEAVKRGAFGAPIFFVRRASEPTEKAQMHFGADRWGGSGTSPRRRTTSRDHPFVVSWIGDLVPQHEQGLKVCQPYLEFHSCVAKIFSIFQWARSMGSRSLP
ncbi:glutathione Stransferase kappa 1, putative, partial [Acanthamoeba castellanii str. Neff]